VGKIAIPSEEKFIQMPGTEIEQVRIVRGTLFSLGGRQWSYENQ
jgi:hypothetical protein